RTLGLNSQTVAKWLARSRFERLSPARHSILDPHKPHITKLLEAHPHSVEQVFLRLRHKGYRGGLTILRDYIRSIRPSKICGKPRRECSHWTRARIKEVAITWSTLPNLENCTPRRTILPSKMVRCPKSVRTCGLLVGLRAHIHYATSWPNIQSWIST